MLYDTVSDAPSRQESPLVGLPRIRLDPGYLFSAPTKTLYRWGRYAGLKTCWVDVHESATPYAVDVIMGFSSTASMNGFTPDRIFSLFPAHVFSGISFYSGARSPDRRHIIEYRSRGFKVVMDNRAFTEDCGRLCPELRHAFYRTDLTMLLSYRRSFTVACEPDEFETDIVPRNSRWSFGTCINRFCVPPMER